ncbi:LPS export ABC transporter ATP-binding protein [Candidatus Sumerlaeota bacterium]|nr:LPS export ABC transporter ATP-binding protein [Candidatus Sumerlaeota bacterium]
MSDEKSLSRLYTDELVKEYGGRRVVNKVSIEVRQGEIVGLLGRNGAGKTTTFNMIVGITRPNGGKVCFDDVDMSDMPIHRRARLGIGYLAQDTSVFRKLSVEQNIRAIAEVLPNMSEEEKEQRVELLLEELGIARLRNSIAYTLSGGERRRTEIARALMPKPKFILLDEPFSGVDPKAVEEIQSIIRQMRDRGLGILITDHNVRETLTVTQRAYIIDEGNVLVSGTSEELVNDEKARQIYLGEKFYIQLDQDR